MERKTKIGYDFVTGDNDKDLNIPNRYDKEDMYIEQVYGDYQKMMAYDGVDYIIYNYKDVEDMKDMRECLKDLHDNGDEYDDKEHSPAAANNIAKCIFEAIDKLDIIYRGIQEFMRKNNGNRLEEYLDMNHFDDYCSLVYDAIECCHFDPCVEIPFTDENGDKKLTVLIRDDVFVYICDDDKDFYEALYDSDVDYDAEGVYICSTVEDCFNQYENKL